MSDTPLVKPQAQSSINPLAIPGADLAKNTKFRVIAYRANGEYHTHKDYTVGLPGEPLALDGGAPYTLIVYSYGSTFLPNITTETSNINSNPLVDYNDSNRDFM
ncbi:TPA: hypothetical protein ACGZ99_003685, partial [Elizabethkingia anophelis]